MRRRERQKVYNAEHGIEPKTIIKPIRDSIEALSGVEEGDRVVVEGLFALRDGAAVEVDEGTGGDLAWSE